MSAVFGGGGREGRNRVQITDLKTNELVQKVTEWFFEVTYLKEIHKIHNIYFKDGERTH